MEQNLHTPEVYDFRQYDRLWKRVAPGLEPYPPAGGNRAAEAAVPPLEEGRRLAAVSGAPGLPAAASPISAPPAAGEGESAGLLRRESQLPGADQDPCCMGTAAEEMLEVLVGFAEEELEDHGSSRPWPGRAPPGPGRGCESWRRRRASTPGG